MSDPTIEGEGPMDPRSARFCGAWYNPDDRRLEAGDANCARRPGHSGWHAGLGGDPVWPNSDPDGEAMPPTAADVIAQALGASLDAEVGGEPVTEVYRPEGLALVVIQALRDHGWTIVPADATFHGPLGVQPMSVSIEQGSDGEPFIRVSEPDRCQPVKDEDHEQPGG